MCFDAGTQIKGLFWDRQGIRHIFEVIDWHTLSI